MCKGWRPACGLALAGGVACGGVAKGTSSDGGAPDAGGGADGSATSDAPADGSVDGATDGATNIGYNVPEGGVVVQGTHDGGGPVTISDGAAPSCPATYADVPQFSPCSGTISCNYCKRPAKHGLPKWRWMMQVAAQRWSRCRRSVRRRSNGESECSVGRRAV